MNRILSRLLASAIVATALPPRALDAQDPSLTAGTVRLQIAGRMQAQMRHSSVEAAPATDFLIRRARITADVTVNDWLSGRVQPDFAGGDLSLKDAYARLTFSPSLRVTTGQFKRPFDVFELESSTLLPIVERDGRIPGLDTCPGVGRICSLSRFTESLEYSDRDLGVMVDGRLGGVRYALSVTNGTGSGEDEENDGKSVAGRLEWAATDALTLAANVSVHDHPDPADPLSDDSEYAAAWGVDLQWGDFLDPGLHVIWGLVGGDNWKVLDPSLDPEGFLATQLLASWYRPLGGEGVFEAWAPLARVSWGDPTDLEDDSGILMTPGLMFYIRDRNAVGANVDVWLPEEGDTEYSLKVQTFLHF